MSIIDRIPAPWSVSQRKVIIGFLAILLVYGSVRLLNNRTYVSNPQPASPPHAADLADRIDPNTADAPTLAVLPLIGEKRAADIVAYRDRRLREHPGELAFENVEDLQKIRGIGPATVEQIRPYLIFGGSSPTTEP